jgi:hypothetical protein
LAYQEKQPPIRETLNFAKKSLFGDQTAPSAIHPGSSTLKPTPTNLKANTATALRMRCVKNNGHVYMSQRDAGEELGHKNRNEIANWFRELQHYGFIVQTEGASLGVDGKGMAPHWLITDMPTRNGTASLTRAPATSYAGMAYCSSRTLHRRGDGVRRSRLTSKCHSACNIGSAYCLRKECYPG